MFITYHLNHRAVAQKCGTQWVHAKIGRRHIVSVCKAGAKRLNTTVQSLYENPHKRRHSRWKLSQELKGKSATFFAKYTCVEMASRKIQTYQNKAKNLYTIYFVFDLDGECKFIKPKIL